MFKLVKNLNGRVEAPDVIELNAVAGTYVEGEALVYSGSSTYALTKASGAKTVLFICAENKTLSAAGKLLVYRVTDGMVFECPASGGVNGGAHYQINSDGLGITTSDAGYLTGTVASTTATINDAFGALVLETIAAAGTALVALA